MQRNHYIVILMTCFPVLLLAPVTKADATNLDEHSYHLHQALNYLNIQAFSTDARMHQTSPSLIFNESTKFKTKNSLH